MPDSAVGALVGMIAVSAGFLAFHYIVRKTDMLNRLGMPSKDYKIFISVFALIVLAYLAAKLVIALITRG